jgi:hypothetical protein
MSTRLVRSLTAMALLAPIALAQNGGTTPTPAPKPAPAPQTAPAATPPKAAPAPQAAMTASPSVPVTGVTADNADKVTKALKDYSNTVWKCGSCGEMTHEAGQCCGKEKTAQTGMAFATVKIDPATSMLVFTVAPAHEIKLSEIERLLTANNIKVARDKMAFGTSTELVISPVADQAAADAIKKALIDAKVFEQIDIQVPAGHKEAHLVVLKAGASAPTEARVKETLAKANSSASLADVAWSAPAARS